MIAAIESFLGRWIAPVVGLEPTDAERLAGMVVAIILAILLGVVLVAGLLYLQNHDRRRW